MAKKKNKKNIFKTLKDFFIDVKQETKKVIWTSKSNLFKYSVATLSFMIFICLFFVGTDLIVALLSYVKELVS